ncbi:MAG: hypothetical protein ACUVQ9_05060, partial [Thermodesulfobacteriota bacterium]
PAQEFLPTSGREDILTGFMSISQWIFRGRTFKEEEIDLIKGIIKDCHSKGRRGIARIICERIRKLGQNKLFGKTYLLLFYRSLLNL